MGITVGQLKSDLRIVSDHLGTMQHALDLAISATILLGGELSGDGQPDNLASARLSALYIADQHGRSARGCLAGLLGGKLVGLDEAIDLGIAVSADELGERVPWASQEA